jgi:hypothetical protein
LLLLVLLSGCGGGGGGQAYPLSSQLRRLQAGDTFTYRATGTLRGGDGQNIDLSGTATGSVAQTTLNGQAVLAQSFTLNLTADGQPLTFNVVRYLVQDPNTGDLLLVGEEDDENNQRLLTTPVLYFPGTFGTNVSYTQTRQYTDGETSQISFSVQGTETVSVPAGRFETWRCLETETEGQNVANTTYLIAPQLGTPVKITNTSTDPITGLTITVDARLTSTNVPLQ